MSNNTVMNVGIEEPVQRRKDILNIAVDTIQALKDFEIYKKVNKEKAVYRKHFIQVIKELSQAIQEFKEKLPVTHIPHKAEEKEPEKKAEVEVIRKIVKRKPSTELDRLESDISSLRDKIANL